MSMIVTTAKQALPEQTEEALQLAKAWQESFEPRKKQSFQKWLQKTGESIYVVGTCQDKLYHPFSSRPLTFHPSMAWIRFQRMQRGEQDPLLEALSLKEGMSFFDATLGLASDSITAILLTGPAGKTTGIEWNPYVARLVKKGLCCRQEESPAFNQAMARIDVRTGDHIQLLQQLPGDSYDVVYFDPMFEKAQEASVHLAPLRKFASSKQLQAEALEEAARVAYRRVVVKTTYMTPLLHSFGFHWKQRAGASFSYAVLLKGANV